MIGGHPGFDGGLAVRVPAGVQNGSVVRVPGAGMPILGLGNASEAKGDAFLLVNVRTTAAERELLAAHAVLLRSVFSLEEKTVEGVVDGVEEGVQVEKN